MAAHDPPRESLAGLLERQHEVLAALLALSRRQGDHIDAEDDEGVLAVLAERQPLVDELLRLGDRIRPLRAAWERHVGALPAAQRHQVARHEEEIAVIARSLAARDEDHRASLARRRNDLADQLAELGTRRGALSAYRGVVPGGATYQDREA